MHYSKECIRVFELGKRLLTIMPASPCRPAESPTRPNDSPSKLAEKIKTMEEQSSLLDARLAEMRQAEQSLQQKGAAMIEANELAQRASTAMHRFRGEGIALQQQCSTLQGQVQQLQTHGISAAAFPAAAQATAAPLTASSPTLFPPQPPSHLGELWSHATAPVVAARESLAAPTGSIKTSGTGSTSSQEFKQ